MRFIAAHMELIISKQETIQHKGKTFELVCSNYGNVIFVLVSDTALQKMGTLLHVKRVEVEPDSDSTYSIHTVLGNDRPEFLVFGRAIGERILTPGMADKSLVVACGFLEADPNMISSLLSVLDKVNVWNC